MGVRVELWKRCNGDGNPFTNGIMEQQKHLQRQDQFKNPIHYKTRQTKQ